MSDDMPASPVSVHPPSPQQRYLRLRPNERRALEDYLIQLRARFGEHIRHVILYGSRARLSGDQESDLDVLIVIDREDWLLANEVADQAFGPSLQHGVLISPQVWSEDHFQAHRRFGLLIYRNIERDGIELWSDETKSPLFSIG